MHSKIKNNTSKNFPELDNGQLWKFTYPESDNHFTIYLSTQKKLNNSDKISVVMVPIHVYGDQSDQICVCESYIRIDQFSIERVEGWEFFDGEITLSNSPLQ